MAPDDLGIRIRRARERLDMSQAQLAAAINRSVRAVGSWERGEAIPRNAIGLLEHVLHADLTSADEPDPNEQEIRSLAARLGLGPEDTDEWIALYRRRRPPVRERAG